MFQFIIFDSVMKTRDRFKNKASSKSHIVDLCASAWYLSIIAVCMILFGCTNPNQRKILSGQDIPVIDLSKNYPEKEFVADETDREYVPLETTDDVLADRDFKIEYLSDQRIVGTNRNKGDIFIFNRDGKIVSFFNHKGAGPNEYINLSLLIFDEKAKEIFVDIVSQNKCLVFSSDGLFLRQINYPDSSRIGNLYDFDEQTLLAYNRLSPVNNNLREIDQIMPYVFLSKKDGSLVSRLDLSFPDRLPDSYMLQAGEAMYGLGIQFGGNLKYGNDFLIVNRSVDTVFLLTQDKKTTPLFVRTPSVHSENQLLSMIISFRTDTYLFFESITYNWSEISQRMLSGQRPNLPPARKFAYNTKTGQLFSVSKGPIAHAVDKLGEREVNLLSADQLNERLKNGELDGKLKQVAQKIDPEDNPVIEIIKYK